MKCVKKLEVLNKCSEVFNKSLQIDHNPYTSKKSVEIVG